MNFLPAVYVTCEACNGKRYNRETLEIAYKGKNIADVLDMTVDEGVDFFRAVPKIYDPLLTLAEVGLGYIHLGQQATTLSGGEAQRVKLATELSRKATGKTLYILDEPTTGLHFHDVAKLLEVLFKLRDAGNTLLVIEHNLDVIKTADWIIDLGPEGGSGGGKIVAEGPPEKIIQCAASFTGHYLKSVLALNFEISRFCHFARRLDSAHGIFAAMAFDFVRARFERRASFSPPARRKNAPMRPRWAHFRTRCGAARKRSSRSSSKNIPIPPTRRRPCCCRRRRNSSRENCRCHRAAAIQTNLAKAGKLADQYVYWIGEAQFQNGELFRTRRKRLISLAQKLSRITVAVAGGGRGGVGVCEACRMAASVALLEKQTACSSTRRRLDPGNELVARGELLLAQAKFALKDFAGAAAILEPLINPQTLQPELDWQRHYLFYQVKLAAGDFDAALAATTNLVQTRASSQTNHRRSGRRKRGVAAPACWKNWAARPRPSRRIRKI